MCVDVDMHVLWPFFLSCTRLTVQTHQTLCFLRLARSTEYINIAVFCVHAETILHWGSQSIVSRKSFINSLRAGFMYHLCLAQSLCESLCCQESNVTEARLLPQQWIQPIPPGLYQDDWIHFLGGMHVSHGVQTEVHSNRLWRSLFRNEFMETAFKMVIFYIGFYDCIKNYIDKLT